MIHLRQHVFAAALQGDLVILDVRDDSYQVLQGAMTSGDLGVRISGVPGSAHPHAADALTAAGLCDDLHGVHRQPLRKPDPRPDVQGRRFRRATLLDLALFATATLRTGWRLVRNGTCRTFHHERMTVGSDDGGAAIEEALARLRHLRLYVPAPKRCLPASLLTAFFLRMKGIDCEIAFGVRSHPFEAHCWVERGGVVLDDDHDRVIVFAPLAIGRP